MTMSGAQPDYGTAAYWDNRYKRNPEAFDWYLTYRHLRDFLIDPHMTEDSRILVVGCGNSRLSEQLYEDGYRNVCSIDYSDTVIQQMKEACVSKRELEFQVMDVRMLDFPSESFDLIVDKGCLDSLLCGDSSFSNASLMLKECSRVLRPGGRYISVSYGGPDLRLEHLEVRDLKWSVYTQRTDPVSLKEQSDDDDDSSPASAQYYVYTCTKDEEKRTAVHDDDDEEDNGGNAGEHYDEYYK